LGGRDRCDTVPATAEERATGSNPPRSVTLQQGAHLTARRLRHVSSTPTAIAADFKVADLSLAEFGRKEITLAEHEMPGPDVDPREFAQAAALKGARITGSLHMTIQTAVLIETLTALGAEVRWCSCNIFSTRITRGRRGGRP